MVTTYLNGNVSLYDSKFTGKFPRSLEEQICKVYQNALVDDNLVVAVQQSIPSIDRCSLKKENNTISCGSSMDYKVGQNDPLVLVIPPRRLHFKATLVWLVGVANCEPH